MQVSERQKTTPVGLARFLVTHRDHDGFETLRDSSLVTVICTGCESSFSYLKTPEQEAPADIDEALARITGSRNGGNGAQTRPTDPDEPPKRRASPAPPEAPEAALPEQANGTARAAATGTPPRRRLAPPGPLAPRRRGKPTAAERFFVPLRETASDAIAWAVPRRRTIALAVVALAGVYVVLSLILGERAEAPPSRAATPRLTAEDIAPAASTTATPPPSEPATPDEGPMATGARPLGSFAEGGPDVQDQTVSAGNFALAVPPDWSRGTTADGSTAFSSDDDGGEVVIRPQPRGTLTYGQMTDEAATYIAGRVEPGTPVERPAWTHVGNLLSVAVASETDGHSEIAYIGVTPSTRFLVVRSIEPYASALVRLQADGIVRSLTAQ